MAKKKSDDIFYEFIKLFLASFLGALAGKIIEPSYFNYDLLIFFFVLVIFFILTGIVYFAVYYSFHPEDIPKWLNLTKKKKR